jgi:hypothetical protein
VDTIKGEIIMCLPLVYEIALIGCGGSVAVVDIYDCGGIVGDYA